MYINWSEIEKKWQQKWTSEQVYKVNEDPNKEKFYVLDMFPYPSGAGLHVGHPKGYIATDTLARKKMLEGFSVLHPMGFDTFGLGTEQYAIDHQMKPQIVAAQNIENFKKQLASMGFSYDWERSFSTADPEYYKRTQWIFLQLYTHYYDEKDQKAKPLETLEKKLKAEGLSGKALQDALDKERLAYIDYKPINRCPHCQTGLANEDLEDGKCERCGSEVEQRPMRQWVLRITKYADRLLEGLDGLNWDESMKELERNRIGKSSGTQFKMNVSRRDGSLNRPNDNAHPNTTNECRDDGLPRPNVKAVNNKELFFEVFTTRIDTVFGMSFVVMAPEHPLVDQITMEEYKDKVEAYKQQAKYKTQLERTELQKEKTGQFTGAYAINPFNGEKVPIFIGDYVLANYGTGVVMAVPAHDERDFEFAKKYDIPIVQSIAEYLIGPSGEEDSLPKADVETLVRTTIDAIIENDKGEMLLQREENPTKVHFVGGGIDVGEDEITALKREIIEETGYTDFEIVGPIINSNVKTLGYRHTKQKNQLTTGRAWHIKLKSENKIPSEVEQGKHTLMRIKKEKVLDQISRKHHRFFYEQLSSGGFATTEKGVLIDSGTFTGLTSDEAIKAMQIRLAEKGLGGEKHNYKIQDWVFSRQRYWGEPFPIVFCPEHGGVAMKESDLPLTLPDIDKYEPTGREEGPLDDVKWRMETPCPICGKPAKRESNTMPGWAGSSRYRLRYMDPKNDKALVSKENEHYRGNVDVYVGGAEHVTRHMIYARFWQKFLFDIGVVSHQEPFQRYEKVGLIMAEDGRKMSKRRGNVVNPDEVIAEYGADAFRMYEMFMGPFDQFISRNTNGLKGVKKFIDKVIALRDKVGYNDDCRDDSLPRPNGEAVNFANETPVEPPKTIETLLHQTIKKTTEDIDAFRFNTTISQFMILANTLSELDKVPKQLFETFIILLAPFAPHLAEEFRSLLGNEFSIFTQAKRPQRDEKKLTTDTITLAIQFNGKVRGTLEVALTASEDEVLELIKTNDKLNEYLHSGTVKKIIYVPRKIMNVVIG